MVKLQETGILPQINIEKLFLNVKEIFQLHKDFLKSLAQKYSSDYHSIFVGKPFIDFWTKVSTERQLYANNL